MKLQIVLKVALANAKQHARVADLKTTGLTDSLKALKIWKVNVKRTALTGRRVKVLNKILNNWLSILLGYGEEE